jgi:hypothetical protein
MRNGAPARVAVELLAARMTVRQLGVGKKSARVISATASQRLCLAPSSLAAFPVPFLPLRFGQLPGSFRAFNEN